MPSRDEFNVDTNPLSPAVRRAMLEYYSVPGRDERVILLLEQLQRAEEKLAQQARQLEISEARLSRGNSGTPIGPPAPLFPESFVLDFEPDDTAAGQHPH